MTVTVRRTCPLCEATCGLLLELDGDDIVGVRGDDEHPLSRGFICPKGAAFGALDHDPDRLTSPRVRTESGWRDVSWDEAFEAVEAGLRGVDEAHGRDAVALYLGNPTIHTLAGQLYARVFRQALRPGVMVTASTVDQMPKHRSAGEMFGDPLAIPVPDIDRTDLLVILGGNPMMSNGSLWTVPDFPNRLKELRARGGTVVVVDPRRSRTAAKADRHLAIRPGTDALLLAAMVTTVAEEGLVELGALTDRVAGLDEAVAALAELTPEAVSDACGLAPDDIRGLAREIAAADRAVVYGRIGTTTTTFGTLASWLVDVLNVITGHLDRPGTAMFPRPFHEDRSGRKPQRFGRFRSRVSGHPEVLGEIPAVALGEEITTPGPGQLRALFVCAGNPVLSTPGGEDLADALDTLDFMVAVDPYVTATSRHADVILPPPPNRYRGHADMGFAPFFVRHVVQYTPPPLPLPDQLMAEEEIYLRLAAIAQGAGTHVDPDALDDLVAHGLAGQLAARVTARTNDLGPEELLAAVSPRRGPERLLDLMIRSGPVGDGFEDGDGLSLDRLAESPSGVDLGPLEPRIDEAVVTESGLVELAPAAVIADVPRLVASMGDLSDGPLLVGRRHLRTNNSWMHNLATLNGTKSLCTLSVHPDDAAAWGLLDGGRARVRSDDGEVEVPVHVTDEIRRGVVSLPHGFGHDLDGVEQPEAAKQDGANVNRLLSRRTIDPLSGTSALNAVPVRVVPA